ncbi:MAG: hypothetical protein JWQ89_3161 [Devosia sp.]|jgi:hypothetical protein|nr:hypothetical protein [Devosia sp.]
MDRQKPPIHGPTAAPEPVPPTAFELLGVISMNADRRGVPDVHLVEPPGSGLRGFGGTSWGISRLHRHVCPTAARSVAGPSPTKPRAGAQRITESEPMVSG